MKQKKKFKKRAKYLLPVFLSFAISANMVACTKTNAASGQNGKYTYSVTEEGNSEIILMNQPTSSHWFPEELLSWNPQEDKNAKYNISSIPLAERVDKEKLSAVNDTQNKDMNVVAISIMNSSTSGNPSQGTTKFGANTFSYWQYIDKLVYWGGSSGEGIIVPPSPDVTDSAHKNGVPVLGTVFFPMGVHGGKTEWLDQFLTKDANGSFPMVDKLIEVARTYKFDGWFINQETETYLTKEHAVLMQEFIKEFKAKSEDQLEIMWYDSMTVDAEMDWQNALTEKNDFFLIDGDKESVADSMFLNFWWSEDKYADEELLKASRERAEELGLDPYELYAGIDVQANGTLTPTRWDLFENGKGNSFTSLGLYCPSWTYFSSNTADEFESKESKFWVNEFGNPAVATGASDIQWKGISTYALEKTVVNSIPFTTNFNLGNGYNFFIDGEKVSTLDWNNRSLADIMPTYRWIIDNEGNNQLKANMDFSSAYYGGNSIKLAGNLDAGKASTIKLFSADLALEKGVTFTTTAKSTDSVNLDLILEFHDGTTETIKGDKAIGDDWTTVTYDVSKLTDKSIKTISYKLSSDEAVSGLAFNLGNITVSHKDSSQLVDVTEVKVEDVSFEEDNMYAGARLTWNEGNKEDINHYEIYRVNADNSKSFLGATVNNNFYVNALKRSDNSNTTNFEVVAVNKNSNRGKSSTASMEWPANDIPKANFNVSSTLVAPGEEITFENLSSEITEEVVWSFPGASVETSSENSPKISYVQEGTYTVTLTAKNDKGEDVMVMEDMITVSEKAAGDLALLSQNKEVTASSFVNNNEAPNFAVDGDTSTKWCAVGKAPHDITIDLGDVKTISEISIAHAETGGENSDMNSKQYTVETSVDGVEFTEVLSVNKNSLGNPTHSFKATDARYVRVNIIKPTQGSDSAARIYEIEVRGIDGTIK